MIHDSDILAHSLQEVLCSEVKVQVNVVNSSEQIKSRSEWLRRMRSIFPSKNKTTSAILATSNKPLSLQTTHSQLCSTQFHTPCPVLGSPPDFAAAALLPALEMIGCCMEPI